jgi:hypothetical protein
LSHAAPYAAGGAVTAICVFAALDLWRADPISARVYGNKLTGDRPVLAEVQDADF